VAIPVTTQMKKADQQQLQNMLGPIARAWFEHKLKKVQQLFEDTITGDTIGKISETIEQATADLAALQTSMDVCAKEHG
jgi:hypothetical protein